MLSWAKKFSEKLKKFKNSKNFFFRIFEFFQTFWKNSILKVEANAFLDHLRTFFQKNANFAKFAIFRKKSHF